MAVSFRSRWRIFSARGPPTFPPDDIDREQLRLSDRRKPAG
jgi:hypothetical protein